MLFAVFVCTMTDAHWKKIYIDSRSSFIDKLVKAPPGERYTYVIKEIIIFFADYSNLVHSTSDHSEQYWIKQKSADHR